MKWINLKIKNLPGISLEVERAVETFGALFERYDREARKGESRKEDYKQLVRLKEEFVRRIAALDAFYDKHYCEEYIAVLHMLKLKLQRCIFKLQTEELSNSIEYLSMINEHDEQRNLSGHLQHEITMLEQPLSAYFESNRKKQQIEFKRFEQASKKHMMKVKNMNSSSKTIKKSQQAGQKQKVDMDHSKSPKRVTVRNVIEVFEDEKEVEKKKSKNNIVKNDRSIGKRELGNGSNYQKGKQVIEQKPKQKERNQSEQLNANKKVQNIKTKTTKQNNNELPKQKSKISSKNMSASNAVSQVPVQEQPAELHFIIKMSKKEYEELQQLKRKQFSQKI